MASVSDSASVPSAERERGIEKTDELRRLKNARNRKFESISLQRRVSNEPCGGCRLPGSYDCQQDPPNSVSLDQAIRNTRSAIIPSVIREIEIWRAAVLMVNRYADEANSFQRAEELAAEGDHAGAAIWRRVTVAIEQLTDTTGPLN
jgi:hypothetical protein